MIHHYPLQWPPGWPKTSTISRTDGGFKVGYDDAVRSLAEELERLNASSAYISTDQELRVNGTPRRDRDPLSPAVAVYFVRNGKQLCIPCDKFTTVRGNIRALALTLESIRRMERYGTNQIVEATLSGFTAIPATASPSVEPRPWHEVLQVSPYAGPEVIKAAWKSQVSKYHPDNQDTGDAAKFQEVQRAYKESGVVL